MSAQNPPIGSLKMRGAFSHLVVPVRLGAPDIPFDDLGGRRHPLSPHFPRIGHLGHLLQISDEVGMEACVDGTLGANGIYVVPDHVEVLFGGVCLWFSQF